MDSVDLQSLEADKVLFYFGVLTLQCVLSLPKVEYSQDATGGWGAMLMIGGYTLVVPHLFVSRLIAKVEVCRDALDLLRARYPQWILLQSVASHLEKRSTSFG